VAGLRIGESPRARFRVGGSPRAGLGRVAPRLGGSTGRAPRAGWRLPGA
jgi:hypothetical protein